MKDLRHRHIIALPDHGSAGSAFYLVMELCEGGSWRVDGTNGGITMQAHAHRNGFSIVIRKQL
jgi:serine/threonine protein kinase